MKLLLTIALLSALQVLQAQNSSSIVAHQNATASGSISIPALQSLKLEVNYNRTIQFDNAEELDNGKILPGFLTATVVSNVPYFISVKCINGTTTSGQEMPASILSLRNSSGAFLPLSSSFQPLFFNNSDKMRTVFTADAKLHPGWNYAGGQYTSTLMFTLTPQ